MCDHLRCSSYETCWERATRVQRGGRGELELTRRGPPSLLLDWAAHLLQYRHAALTFFRFASLEAEDAFASDMTRDDRWGGRARRKGSLSCLEGGSAGRVTHLSAAQETRAQHRRPLSHGHLQTIIELACSQHVHGSIQLGLGFVVLFVTDYSSSQAVDHRSFLSLARFRLSPMISMLTPSPDHRFILPTQQACRFSEWYPTFKRNSIRGVVHKFDAEEEVRFRAWFDEDGMRLPEEVVPNDE